MTNLTKEPLVHFFLIGAALFLLHGWRGNPAPGPGAPSGTPTAQIVVTAEDLRQLEGVFGRTWQRPPTAEERARLVEDLVRNEIYYREALAIGLDRDDQVLKRRLRQKMEFVFEDVSAWVEPTDQDLEAFMRRHRERYLADPAIAFEHGYFSPSRRGPSAEPDARKALAQLAGGVDPQERLKTLPEYRVLSEAGPDHRKEFTVELFVKGAVYGRGTGKSKQGAEQKAAKEALEKLSSSV